MLLTMRRRPALPATLAALLIAASCRVCDVPHTVCMTRDDCPPCYRCDELSRFCFFVEQDCPTDISMYGADGGSIDAVGMPEGGWPDGNPSLDGPIFEGGAGDASGLDGPSRDALASPDGSAEDGADLDSAAGDLGPQSDASTIGDASGEDAGIGIPADLTWVHIPSGSFEMGCTVGDTNCAPNELPRHTVAVSPFQMLQTETTQAQYLAVMGENPSFFSESGAGADCGLDCPVERVDWDQAKSFCEAVGGRLPSEAEWEYAVRAGTTTRYSCGDDAACLDRAAWYVANADDTTHPVGSKPANAFGLNDMDGNVWEWVEDCWHESYAGAPETGEFWAGGNCGWHVLRGGAYDWNPTRVSERVGTTPGGADINLGFRCARDIPIPPSLTWLDIPGDTFQMGCSDGDRACTNAEREPHPVTVAPFQMLETEVTQAQYLTVMGENPSWFGDCGPNCPVESMTWQKARDFCVAIHGRLPSEAEWEYAARAGSTTRYACGDDVTCLDSIAWYSAISNDTTHPVGEKDANPFGLYDMHGNVAEWVEDFWHADYNGAPSTGEVWSGGDINFHTLRMGAWSHTALEQRVSNRASRAAEGAYAHAGFRCVR